MSLLLVLIEQNPRFHVELDFATASRRCHPGHWFREYSELVLHKSNKFFTVSMYLHQKP